MTKTDNEKYVKRGADLFIEYNPEWEDEVNHANERKVGAPYLYSETLIMLAAALRVGMGVQYRQLEGAISKMIGESKTPSFSQLRKRMGKLDVNTDQCGMITVSDRKRSRILAVDASGLKLHNRGEWMRKKWKVKRGFVKLHVMVDTQTMKIVALSVTDESVGDVTEFRSLLGQSMDAIDGAKGGAPDHPKDPSPDAPAVNRDGGAGSRPRGTGYQNRLAAGTPPLTPSPSDRPDNDDGDDGDDPAAADIVYGDAAYGSRDNAAACASAGVVPGILHRINVTARGKGSGDAWGMSVRDQLGGIPEAVRLDLMSQEEKRENQTYWKARIGYNMRWVVEGVFSIFKRMFGEHVMALKWENIIQEIRLKVALYNRWRDESIARELGMGVPHTA